MSSLKRITAIALSILMLFSCISFAEDGFSGVNNDFEVTVSGKAQATNAFLTLFVLKPGYTAEEAINEYEASENTVTSLEAVMWLGHTVTGADGSFALKIRFPDLADAGDYQLYALCGDETFEGVMRYVSNTNKQTAINAFNGVTDITALAKAVSDKSFVLSIFEGDDETAALYEKYNSEEKLYNIFSSFGTYSEEIEKLNESAALINKNLETALKLMEIENCDDKELLVPFVENNADFLGLNLSGITEENKSFVYDALVTLEDIVKVDDIANIIDGSVILYEIVNAENWGSIKTVYETYAEKLQVNVTSSKVDYTKVYRGIYSQRAEIESVEEAVSEFERYCRLYPKQAPSAGGGGGGGGGSVSEIPDSGVVSKPVITEPEKEEVKEEIKEEVKMNFSDVTEDFWAYDAVRALYEKGIIKGMEENRFGANNNITREEVAALSVRAFGLELKDSAMLFKDVSSEAWYAAEVMIAASNGVLKGYPDGTFGAGRSITRQDLAVMLYNTLTSEGEKLSSVNGKKFTDEDSISAYALEAVKAMSSEGIINGYEDGSFRPEANATRAEVASLIYKLLGRVAK